MFVPYDNSEDITHGETVASSLTKVVTTLKQNDKRESNTNNSMLFPSVHVNNGRL
jgi:hypothetical protein